MASRVDVVINTLRAALASLTEEERAKVMTAIAAPIDVRGALDAANGNISVAARALGVSRPTFRSWMQKLGLPPGKPGRRPPKLTG